VYSSECHYLFERVLMEKTVSAADANRRFSEVLRTVRRGDSVLVTSHGKPVARIVPAAERASTHRAARSALLARLRRERVVTIGRWTRDELYEGMS
jgi:prevent-host-death family protein